ncbi:hypothetical protein MRX96_021387 [Rhipicephalus microplus]
MKRREKGSRGTIFDACADGANHALRQSAHAVARSRKEEAERAQPDGERGGASTRAQFIPTLNEARPPQQLGRLFERQRCCELGQIAADHAREASETTSVHRAAGQG